jgi:glycosyltransferase involved in cell wall biosynthesis
MKVLVLSNLYPPETIGGYEIQCSEAVGDLRQRGHDVVVLTSVPRRPIEDRQQQVLRVLRTPDVYSPGRNDIRSPFWEFESNLLNVENIYLLLNILDGWRPDVCYLWNLVAVGGAGILAVLECLGVPWVWHLGDAVPAMLCNFHGELRALGTQMGRQLSGRFLACSRTVVDRVERLVPIRSRTRIVPNWVRRTAPAIERDYFDRGRPLRLAYAGRLAEEKGVLLLPEMVARLLEMGYSRFAVEIMGTGMAEEMAARISELGIEDHASLHGWLPHHEVERHLAQCDVFVFPTYMEDPMPLAPLEAAAVGCVPLIPWVSGVSEWLVDGVHCLKADRTAQGFAEILAKVLDGDVDLKGLSRRAVRAVHDEFAIEAVMPVVESELILAADGKRAKTASSEELYRMALIADALLRRHALENPSRNPACGPEMEV